MRQAVLALGLLVVAGTLQWGQKLTPQVDKDGVYSMGGGVTPAKLIQGFPANYPSDPGLETVKHIVALRVVIGADGTPGEIEVVNARPSRFDEGAIAAVKASQFAPGRYEKNAVPTRMLLWVPFLRDKQEVVPVSASFGAKGVSAPIPLNAVEAEFPKPAPKNLAAGVVLIHLLVTDEGLPSEMRVLLRWDTGLMRRHWRPLRSIDLHRRSFTVSLCRSTSLLRSTSGGIDGGGQDTLDVGEGKRKELKS
jgi:hypothetical protein